MKRLACAASALVLIVVSASATTLHVYPDGSGAWPTIQAAINAAHTGDTILLADGVFRGEGNRDLRAATTPQAVMILSASGDPARSIIDLEMHPLANWGDANLLFEAVGIRGGTGAYAAAAVVDLRECVLDGWNGALSGMWDMFSYEMTDCRVTGCLGLTVSCPNLHLTRCEFEGNAQLMIYIWDVTMIDCRFIDNVSRDGNALVQGFAWMAMSPGLNLQGCRFERNRAPYVLDAMDGFVEATGCVFTGNTGALVHLMPAMSPYGRSRLESCTVVGQTDVAPGRLIVAEDWDPQAPFEIPFDLSHSIFAFNEAPVALCPPGQILSMVVDCCDIYGNTGGDWVGCLEGTEHAPGNFSLDPLFCGWPYGWVELRDDSPCAQPTIPCGLVGALPVGCTLSGVDDVANVAAGPRLTAFPSPAAGAVQLRLTGGPARSDVSIRIADASGRIVRDLTLPAGASAIPWDGRAADGRAVPAGIYFARLRASTTPVVIVR